MQVKEGKSEILRGEVRKRDTHTFVHTKYDK